MFKRIKFMSDELDAKRSNLPNISVQTSGEFVKPDVKSLAIINQLGKEVQRLEKENKRLKAELKSQKAVEKNRAKFKVAERTTEIRVLETFQEISERIVD